MGSRGEDLGRGGRRPLPSRTVSAPGPGSGVSGCAICTAGDRDGLPHGSGNRRGLRRAALAYSVVRRVSSTAQIQRLKRCCRFGGRISSAPSAAG